MKLFLSSAALSFAAVTATKPGRKLTKKKKSKSSDTGGGCMMQSPLFVSVNDINAETSYFSPGAFKFGAPVACSELAPGIELCTG